MSRDIFMLAYDVKMEAESDNAEIMLYGEIVEDGPKWWKWSQEDKSAAEFDKEIKGLKDKGVKKLLLRINSPGGVCTESVAMRSILANAGFEEINIRIEGMCASAATDIATLPGAHVAIAEGSEYMIHNPWCYTLGNANELEHTIARLRNIEQTSRSFYMKKTGQSEEQVKAWMDNETWFTAEQAVEYGFADELLASEVGTPAMACVSSRAMATMKNLYTAVPGDIQVEKPEQKVSTGETTPSEKTKQEEENMELDKLTPEQLANGNPELLAQIQASAVTAERNRIEEIDALTIPGYEDLAAQAKANGTSAMDFQKELVKAMKEKGPNFMAARQQEVTPAQNIGGGVPNSGDEATMIEQNAKEIAAYAAEFSGSAGGMF